MRALAIVVVGVVVLSIAYYMVGIITNLSMGAGI